MPLIISRMQSAFNLVRLIIDNIMVAYQLLHSMKLNKKKRDRGMAIKFNTFKAYNRIEWPYLKVVLTSMGFSERWFRLFMTCVTSIRYSMLVKGSPGETFTLYEETKIG